MNLFFHKRSRSDAPTYYSFFLFFACVLGCFFGCLAHRCCFRLSTFRNPSVLSAFLTTALFLFTSLFLSSFSRGKYACLLLFFLHGLFSGFFLLSLAGNLHLFLCYFFRELFLLTGAFLSLSFSSSRSDGTHLLFPVVILTLFSILGTLVIYL